MSLKLDFIYRPILQPTLIPCRYDSAAPRIVKRAAIKTSLPAAQTASMTAIATAEVAKTFFERLSELFLSAVSNLKTLIKNLPKDTLSYFPVFYAYLLYNYKAIHLQNINICLSASSEPKTMTLILGRGNREYRFTIEIQAGRKCKLLNVEQTDPSAASTVSWTKNIFNPFSFLIWKRHEFQTIYNIHIQDPIARIPRIASFTLPDEKGERLRIIQSKATEQIPIATKENLKKDRQIYNTQRWVCIPPSKGNLHFKIPSLSEGHAPDEYIRLVEHKTKQK
jgi:hypothetical protein